VSHAEVIEGDAPCGADNPAHRAILDRLDYELAVLDLLRGEPNFARRYVRDGCFGSTAASDETTD
jgi:hypothetical protein